VTADGGSSRRRALTGLAAGAALVGLFAVQLWVHATRTSPTLDEPYHILAGYRYWECGDFGIYPEHPPLAKLIAALPIRSWDLAGPPWPCGSRLTPLAEGFQAGTRFALENGIDRVVVPARLASSLVALALAALVALAALEMFGRAEALVALALVAFEPTLVAHGSLASTDMPVTAGLFAAAYALYRYASRPGAARLVAAGLAVGVGLASKHSALVAAPIVCALPLVDAALEARAGGAPRAGFTRRALRSAAAGAAAVGVGLAVLWACYGFRYHALPGAAADGASVEAAIRSSPHPEAAASAAGTVAAVLQRLRLVPEAYTYGLGYVAGYGERPTYLLGARFPTGQWFYFPVAFLIKTSIPLLALLAVALATRELYGRRREMLFLLAPSVAYFALCMTSGVNIGIRHVLPCYPFFAVVAAAGACYWARRSRAALWAVAALLIFHAVTAARTLPDDIAFANDLWGGTSNTWRLLHDSNVDWGQNLEAVAGYLDRERVDSCWFACYGNGEMASAIVPRCRLLPAPGWTNGDTPVEPVPDVLEGTVLVSASVLADRDGAALYAPVASSEPVAVIGGGVLVFRGRFEVPLLAAFGRIDRAGQLARLGRVDEARAELEAVVAAARANPSALGPAGREALHALARLP
jgi:hypothetical protein